MICSSALVPFTARSRELEWVGAKPDQNKKASCTFVFTHGLYGDKNQFRPYADAFSIFGCSSALLTLPGHGPDSENSEKIKSSDWIAFLDSVVTEIVSKSDRTYLVGQSTGGALSSVIAHLRGLRGEKNIDGLWLIEPAFRVRSGPGLGSCLISKITNDVRRWPITAGLFGVEISEKTPKISPQMGCQVDSIWRNHLVTTGLLEPAASSDYFGVIDATVTAFQNLRVPVYVQNTLGDRMVDADVIRLAFEKHEKVRYSETKSPKHGQVVVDNILPHQDLESLLGAGFPLPATALKRHARNLLEAVHFYRRASERDLERRENMLEFLVKYREFVRSSKTADDRRLATVPCDVYVGLIDTPRTTDEVIPEYNACMLSLTQ